jgi:hypothetical protein
MNLCICVSLLLMMHLQMVCECLTQERNLGQRLNIILVAEGALDRNGEAITADKVKNVSFCHTLRLKCLVYKVQGSICGRVLSVN